MTSFLLSSCCKQKLKYDDFFDPPEESTELKQNKIQKNVKFRNQQ